MSGEGGSCRFAEFAVRRSLQGVEVNIASVELAKELFLKRTQRRYRPLVAMLRTALHHTVMIIADGETWQKTHEAIAPHLSARVVSHEYAPIIRRVAEQEFAMLAERATGGGENQPIEIAVEPLMRTVAGSVLGFVLFGHELQREEAQWLEQTLSECTKLLNSGVSGLINALVAATLRMAACPQRQLFLFPRRQRRAIVQLRAWIGAKIDASRRAGLKSPLLESLEQRYADLAPHRRRRCIIAEYAMMLTAGIETTAATLAFGIAEIANQPPLRDAIVQELRGSQSGSADAEALPAQFPLTYRVIRETLRRHTIVPTMLREMEQDQRLSGTDPHTGASGSVTVRRGGVLRFLPMQGNMRASIWSEPRKFNPQRFAQPLQLEQRRNFHSFGIGPQSCPGRAMALTEMILVLRAFFEHLDLEHRPISSGIAVERNLLLTVRPIGIGAAVRAAPRPGPRAARRAAPGGEITDLQPRPQPQELPPERSPTASPRCPHCQITA
jgi:cytochrome P450